MRGGRTFSRLLRVASVFVTSTVRSGMHTFGSASRLRGSSAALVSLGSSWKRFPGIRYRLRGRGAGGIP
jgi:hypothetical protein